MIRNYYTDAFKSGIAVTPSDTLLIDGRARATTPISYWKEYNVYIGNSPIQQDNFGGNTSATANQFRLLRSAEDPENNDIAVANSTQIVCQNLNQYMQNTGTAGITWQ